MNTLTRTIAVLVTLNLLISGLALARISSEGQLHNALVAEAEQTDVVAREAGIAALQTRRRAGTASAGTESVQMTGPGETPALASVRYSTVSRNRWPFQSSGSPVLVIPSADVETEDLLTMNEDMSVMSRIFETNLQRARVSTDSSGVLVSNDSPSALLNVLSSRGKASIQSLFLQGYGALFLTKVDFPLSGTSQAQEEQQPKKDEQGDPVWDRMRERMYNPEDARRRNTKLQENKYDPEKVEKLVTTLVGTLKHAANIRSLKADESVILSITGSGAASSGIKSIRAIPNTDQVVIVDQNNTVTTRKVDSAGNIGFAAATVLVIRAKKADIDSFAKGDLDLDQFRRRVQILSYPYLGSGHQRSDILEDYYRYTPSN